MFIFQKIQPPKLQSLHESHVNTSHPSSVMSTVCSNCAARLASLVATVQPSDQVIHSFVPSVKTGSMVKVVPNCIFLAAKAPRQHHGVCVCVSDVKNPFEPRKKTTQILSMGNPGWLIGILIMAYYNPYITG